MLGLAKLSSDQSPRNMLDLSYLLPLKNHQLYLEDNVAVQRLY